MLLQNEPFSCGIRLIILAGAPSLVSIYCISAEFAVTNKNTIYSLGWTWFILPHASISSQDKELVEA